ncbi:GLPGLI family protein [Flavobacterium sp.]|uniref:GLPGLI family protein n=1 Tax=Flavobacterium sp. TaxID=239 RepID=UPI004048BD66
MKYYYLFILTCFTLIAFSQKSGTITYNFKILEDEKFIKNELIGEFFLQAIEGAKHLKFELTFNDSISEFKLLKNMSLDGQNLEMAIIDSRTRKEIYIFKNKIYHNNANGLFKENEFLIIEPLNQNWKLTNESKIIDGYTCYKATNEYIVDNGKIFKHPVIAWFCPQIPISIGPRGYGGLPGLILELQEWNSVFGVEKMEFSNNVKEIILPKEGKIISEQEYQNKVGAAAKREFSNN